MGRLLCWIRLHKWLFYNPLDNTVACGRRGCQAKKKALPDREIMDLFNCAYCLRQHVVWKKPDRT